MKRFSLPQRTHDRFMRTGGTSAHRAAAHHSPSSDCAVKSVALNTSQALKARLVLPRWNRRSRETFASHVFLPKCWGWHQIKRKSSGKKRGGALSFTLYRTSSEHCVFSDLMYNQSESLDNQVTFSNNTTQILSDCWAAMMTMMKMMLNLCFQRFPP